MVMKRIVCYDNCVRVHIKQFKFSNSFHLLLKKIMYGKNLSIVWRDYNLLLYFMKRCCIRRLEYCIWAVEKKKKVLLARCYCLKSFCKIFFSLRFVWAEKMHFTTFYSILWKSHKYHTCIYMENAHAFQQLLMFSFI